MLQQCACRDIEHAGSLESTRKASVALGCASSYSLAACKRTQHCWQITPNIVESYMLRPFEHPVACCWMLLRVVAQSLKLVKLLSPCKRTQHCWELLRPCARSLTPLSCYPNFPRAQYLDMRTVRHELIVK